MSSIDLTNKLKSTNLILGASLEENSIQKFGFFVPSSISKVRMWSKEHFVNIDIKILG
jgi:hypothetical protein